jgi:putative hemolysin
MTPLSEVIAVPSSALMSEVRHLLHLQYKPIIPIYRHQKQNIVAVAYVRDLLRFSESQPIFEKSRSPWFVTQETSILEILNQFRRNKQSVAVILDHLGQACGILTLDQIVSQIFGKKTLPAFVSEEEPSLYIERTLPGDMTIGEFNREFQADLVSKMGDTLSDFVIAKLGHPPVSGETVRIESFVFTVLEPSLRGVSIVSVRSDY